jgi:two-component system, LytTR family, response regulator
MKLNDAEGCASAEHITPHRQSTTDETESDTLNFDRATNVAKGEDTLRLDDFVFLSSEKKCWLIQTGDIWFLEACGEQTRIHLPDGAVLVRRTLADCERRLDTSMFFRATRDYIINLTHVKQTRLLDSSRVLFILPNGKEVVVSGRQNFLFRKMRAL